MNRNVLLVLGILVIVLGIVGLSALFTVHQTQQAIVLMFGNPKRVATEAGLHFKIPFVENVLYYERRVLNLDPPVESMLLSDQKRILVDAFARYRITEFLEIL
jgi:membrane protease subunit HflC